MLKVSINIDSAVILTLEKVNKKKTHSETFNGEKHKQTHFLYISDVVFFPCNGKNTAILLSYFKQCKLHDS